METAIDVFTPNDTGGHGKVWAKPVFEIISKDKVSSSDLPNGPELTLYAYNS